MEDSSSSESSSSEEEARPAPPPLKRRKISGTTTSASAPAKQGVSSDVEVMAKWVAQHYAEWKGMSDKMRWKPFVEEVRMIHTC